LKCRLDLYNITSESLINLECKSYSGDILPPNLKRLTITEDDSDIDISLCNQLTKLHITQDVDINHIMNTSIVDISCKCLTGYSSDSIVQLDRLICKHIHNSECISVRDLDIRNTTIHNVDVIRRLVTDYSTICNINSMMNNLTTLIIVCDKDTNYEDIIHQMNRYMPNLRNSKLIGNINKIKDIMYRVPHVTYIHTRKTSNNQPLLYRIMGFVTVLLCIPLISFTFILMLYLLFKYL
jgi:hypothetical protein